MDGHRKTLDRLWRELDGNPTPHAVAQLAHALHATLASLATLTGANPPKRTEADIRHHTQEWARGVETLSDAELAALLLLYEKVGGKVPPEVNVLAEIVERYAAGTLGTDPGDVIELVPVEEDG